MPPPKQELRLRDVDELVAEQTAAYGRSIRQKVKATVVLPVPGAVQPPVGFVPVQITGQPETYNAPFNSMRTPLEVLQTGVKVWLFENEDGELEIDTLVTKQTIVQSTSPLTAILATRLAAWRHADSWFLTGSIPTARGGFSLAGLANGELANASGSLISYKHNLTATTDPTISDDNTQGYLVRSIWINTSTGKVFMCFDATTGAAVWKDLTKQGTVTSVGLSTNASYLTIGSTPVTSSGTITANKTTGLTGNQVVATPDGTTGAADLRALVNGDLPVVSLAKGGAAADISGLTTGALIAKGASALGAASLTAHNLIVGNGTGAPGALAPGTAGNIAYSDGTDWQSGSPASAGIGQRVFVQTADGSALTNTTTATDVTGTGSGSLTITGSTLSVGTEYYIDVWLIATTTDTNSRTLDLSLHIGSTVLTTSQLTYNNNYTNRATWYRAEFTVRATGAGGTAFGSSVLFMDGKTPTGDINATATAIDWTTNPVISVYAKWYTATTIYSIKTVKMRVMRAG